MSKTRIVSLNFNHSFGYNLCFKLPNEKCDPTLNIYFVRKFQWFKKTQFDLKDSGRLQFLTF
jgi:hypothetical protein